MTSAAQPPREKLGGLKANDPRRPGHVTEEHPASKAARRADAAAYAASIKALRDQPMNVIAVDWSAPLSTADAALYAQCQRQVSAFMTRAEKLDKARPASVTDEAWQRTHRYVMRGIEPGTRCTFKALPGGACAVRIHRKPITYLSDGTTVHDWRTK